MLRRMYQLLLRVYKLLVGQERPRGRRGCGEAGPTQRPGTYSGRSKIHIYVDLDSPRKIPTCRLHLTGPHLLYLDLCWGRKKFFSHTLSISAFIQVTGLID